MPTSIYLHIPFCRHRCAYCDFNTYAGLESLIPGYVQAMLAEIRGLGSLARAESYPNEIHTIFFGGGTPSLLPPEDVESIVDQARMSFRLLDTAEVTLEANPGTVDPAHLASLREAGVNRLSLGMQSSHPDELELLERVHSMDDVRQAVRWARGAGFDNLNLDLIYGLPSQSLDRWRATLQTALDLGPDHLSLYSLSLEHGTPMTKWVAEGRMAAPDPDRAADMYEWAAEELAGSGFVQYEISNWARPGPNSVLKACRHNLHIWRNGPYLGLGAGAHGCAAGWRTRATLSPRAYMRRLVDARWDRPFPFSPATAWHERQGDRRRAEDMMILGLRLTEEGVSEAAYASAFGQPMVDAFGSSIEMLIGDGLLERSNGRVRLTQRGRLLGNQVFQHFVLTG